MVLLAEWGEYRASGARKYTRALARLPGPCARLHALLVASPDCPAHPGAPGSTAGATSCRSCSPSSSCGSGSGRCCPVLPLYFTEQGVDLATLGLVIAAWPAARLVGEPIFGWLADRTARVPLMVIGLSRPASSASCRWSSPGRSRSSCCAPGPGSATAVYDPAARGYLTDATPPDRRGEAFGLYGAAQMGGLLLGPAIGAFGAAYFGGIAFVFVFSAIAAFAGRHRRSRCAVRETGERTHPAPSPDSTEFPPDSPSIDPAGRRRHRRRPRHADAGPPAPTRLWNRGLIAALVINAGGYFAGGTYEVIWSLFLAGPRGRPRRSSG